jgi:hypothetical protein
MQRTHHTNVLQVINRKSCGYLIKQDQQIKKVADLATF